MEAKPRNLKRGGVGTQVFPCLVTGLYLGPLHWVSQLEFDCLFLAVGHITTDPGPEVVT